MGWRIVKRRLGRAGGPRQRLARQRDWDRRYGRDNWAVGYELDGEFVLREQALESVYQASYDAFLDAHPEQLAELVALAGSLRNPHAEVTGGVDLQVPAIETYLKRRGLELQGCERVDIGSYGEASHPISVRLSPTTIPCVVAPRMTLEAFWQRKKVLAVWAD